jgi:hypothetical protein
VRKLDLLQHGLALLCAKGGRREWNGGTAHDHGERGRPQTPANHVEDLGRREDAEIVVAATAED